MPHELPSRRRDERVQHERVAPRLEPRRGRDRAAAKRPLTPMRVPLRVKGLARGLDGPALTVAPAGALQRAPQVPLDVAVILRAPTP